MADDIRKDTDKHNQAIRGNSREVGLIAPDHDQEENNPNSERHKKKRREELEQIALLNAIDEQLKSLRDQMDRLNKQLEALEKVKDLYLNGNLDYNNSDHQDIMLLAGVTAQELDEDGVSVIERKFTAITEQKGVLQDRIDDFFSDEPISVADKVRETSIKPGVELQSSFARAADPHVVEPGQSPTLQPTAQPNLVVAP